jgi:hypothetical protein
VRTFDELQAGLGTALSLNSPASTTEHVLVVLPSYSLAESLLAHYADRIPALEHRYLVGIGVLGRVDSCVMVFVTSREPGTEVLDYYFSLLPESRRAGARSRFHLVTVPDDSPRSIAEKLLDHPERLEQVRRLIGDRPRYIEPWNVTDHEVAVAVALQAPVNGARPDVLPVAHKSSGRRLFREAGVPLPYGHEDVRTVDDVVRAAQDVHRHRPSATAVVVKHDDSGAGDGNVVIELGPAADVRAQLGGLPAWYVADLAAQGGIVEERVAGVRFASPSAQADIRPDGSVQVLATHEQVLGGPTGQVYMGCRFPADPAYAPRLATYAHAIGERLAANGALGRFAVDFVAASPGDDSWDVYAIEVNLRKGGTTHPYSALRNLVPGRYDVAVGRWVAAADGSERAYSATDNLIDPAWTGVDPAAVIRSVRAAGLEFSHETGTGAVLFMLSALAIDGRMGVVAIGRTPVEAATLEAGVRDAVDRLAATPAFPAG